MSRTVGFGGGRMGNDPGAFINQSGIFGTIVRESAGVWLVTMAAGANLAPSDVVTVQPFYPGPGVPVGATQTAVERVSQTQFRVRAVFAAGGGTPTDIEFYCNVNRVLQG